MKGGRATKLSVASVLAIGAVAVAVIFAATVGFERQRQFKKDREAFEQDGLTPPTAEQAQRYRTVVKQAYTAVLDRFPTREEQDMWVRLLHADEASMQAITERLKESREYKRLRGEPVLDVLMPPIEGVHGTMRDDVREYKDAELYSAILEVYGAKVGRLPDGREMRAAYDALEAAKENAKEKRPKWGAVKEMEGILDGAASAADASAAARGKDGSGAPRAMAAGGVAAQQDWGSAEEYATGERYDGVEDLADMWNVRNAELEVMREERGNLSDCVQGRLSARGGREGKTESLGEATAACEGEQ